MFRHGLRHVSFVMFQLESFRILQSEIRAPCLTLSMSFSVSQNVPGLNLRVPIDLPNNVVAAGHDLFKVLSRLKNNKNKMFYKELLRSLSLHY
jgi:hypothetical protein